MASRKILVTGGNGLIGGRCIALLQDQGESIISLSRSASTIGGLLHESCDLRDANCVEEVIKKHGITHIIHTAGMRTSDCKRNPRAAYEVNVMGTMNLFEAARLSGVERIVLTSTAAVYDVEKQLDLCDEGSPTAAKNPYTSSKLAAEGIAESFYHQYGVSSVALRPQIVFALERTGEGSTIAPSIAMQKAIAGETYHIGFRGHYGFHYAEDIAQQHVDVLFDERLGFECFNSPGIAHSVSQIVHLLNQYARARHSIDEDLISYGGGLHPFVKQISAAKFNRFYPQAKVTSFLEALNGE